uniref:Uncharacterized protein n=1 Tax=Guillardia theta (strain CCMP2712) TaxID=905079 RepID=A0A0C3SRU4_GUITC
MVSDSLTSAWIVSGLSGKVSAAGAAGEAAGVPGPHACGRRECSLSRPDNVFLLFASPPSPRLLPTPRSRKNRRRSKLAAPQEAILC